MYRWEQPKIPSETQRLIASKNYERVYLSDSGDNIYVRPGRTIVETEAVYNKLQNYSQKLWNEKCRPLVQQIKENRGYAHCCPTHDYVPHEGRTWWLYHVDKRGIGFDWIHEPTDKVNHDLGQAYYENVNIQSRAMARANVAKHYFWRLMDFWLWSDEIKPQKYGDMMRVEINSRTYLFVAEPNRHGVLYWKTLLRDSGKLIERKL